MKIFLQTFFHIYNQNESGNTIIILIIILLLDSLWFINGKWLIIFIVRCYTSLFFDWYKEIKFLKPDVAQSGKATISEGFKFEAPASQDRSCSLMVLWECSYVFFRDCRRRVVWPVEYNCLCRIISKFIENLTCKE